MTWQLNCVISQSIQCDFLTGGNLSWNICVIKWTLKIDIFFDLIFQILDKLWYVFICYWDLFIILIIIIGFLLKLKVISEKIWDWILRLVTQPLKEICKSIVDLIKDLIVGVLRWIRWFFFSEENNEKSRKSKN